MTQPTRIEWEVGRDIHNRRVSLIREKNYLGKTEWRIHTEAASQRDESQDVRSLTAEVLLAIGDIAKSEGRGG